MISTSLIIITGISGTGKSTTAIALSNLLTKNGIDHVYLHEECENHPIREDEFSYGSVKSEADMDVNTRIMLERWENFASSIQTAGKLFVLEACLYENIVRYFFECDYHHSRILDFYDRLMAILKPLNPAVVHLRTSDLRTTFEKVFKERGEWWKDLILKDRCKYFINHGYTKDEDNYHLAEDYQNLAVQAFQRYQGPKIYLNTLEARWSAYHEAICSFLEIDYIRAYPKTCQTPEDYCGAYQVCKENRRLGFHVFVENDKLWCRSFWPYMELEYEGNDCFGIKSFPIRLCFERYGNAVTAVNVEGNYDWGLCGIRLEKVMEGDYSKT